MNKFISILLLTVFVACGSSKKVVATSSKVNKPQQSAQNNKNILQEKPTSQNLEIAKPLDKTIVKTDTVKPKTELLEATSKVRVTTEMVYDYVEKFKDIAMHNMKEHGVPASITLAQAILESGAGTGALSLKSNNHFGIKCHKEWEGDSVTHDDDAPQECFRKYEDPAQSFTDHSLFLTSRPWYAPLFKLEKNDYKAWAYGLKKSGYATDPKYPSKLIGLIEKYKLNQYDAEVLGINFQQENVLVPELNSNTSITEGISHTVQQGETLYSISKKYNITVDFLKVKNNLIDNALTIGQTLIIK